MTITELGSVGELIGSIAVLATLVYLAYQTQQTGRMLAQSKEAQIAAQTQGNLAGWDGVFRPILEKPEVARLYRLVKTGERVPTEDEESLESLLFLIALRLENLMIQLRLNPITVDDHEKLFEKMLGIWINKLMKSPSSQQWWNENRTGFTPEFMNRMDDQLARSLKSDIRTL